MILRLSPPTLDYSPLQNILEERAILHSERDIERRHDNDPSYHNGALFGLDPEVPGDEQTGWVVVIPPEGYWTIPALQVVLGSMLKDVTGRGKNEDASIQPA